MSYSYRASVGNALFELPDYTKAEVSFEYSDVAAFSMEYPFNGINVDKLVQDTIIIAYWNGQEISNGRYIVIAGEEQDQTERSTVKIVARSLHDIFRRRVVLPITANSKSVLLKGATAGGIIDTMLTAAQKRGAMTGITWSFNAAHDSLGNAWPMKLPEIEYQFGLKYSDMMQNLFDQGLVEYEFVGQEFRAYIPDAMGRDLTVSPNIVELVAGKDYVETPVRWSTEDRSRFSLAVGDEGVTTSKENTEVPVGPFGRDEQAVSQGGINDKSALDAVNDAAMKRNGRVRQEFTRKVIMYPGAPVPGVDYRVGDFIYDRTGSDVQRYRVFSMVLETSSDGAIGACSLVLNDKFLDNEVRLSRRVSGIIGGASADGSGNGVPTTGDTSEPDTTVPKAPTDVVAISNLYQDSTGQSRSIANIGWDEVTQNTDGTIITDLDHYEIEIRTDGVVTHSAPATFSPARQANDLNTRFDRRGGNVPGWLGADGGGNAVSQNGSKWFFWSDTIWGILGSDGIKRSSAGADPGSYFMPHNTATMTPSGNVNGMQSYAGSRNMMSADAASCAITSPWVGTVSKTTYVDGFKGNALTLSSGSVYTDTAASVGSSHRVMVSLDPSTAQYSSFEISYVSNSGVVASTTVKPSPTKQGLVSTVLPPAPSGTTAVRLKINASGKVVFFKAGVFPSSHQLFTWNLPVDSALMSNNILNPSACGGTAGIQAYGAASAVVSSNTAHWGSTSVSVASTGTGDFGATFSGADFGSAQSFVAFVNPSVDTTVKFTCGNNVSTSVSVKAGVWTEIHSVNMSVPSGTSSVTISSVSKASGQTLLIAEATAVSDPLWDGTGWSGDCKSGVVEFSWSGTRGASKSVAKFHNADYTGDNNQPVSMISGTNISPNIGDFTWVADAAKDPDVDLVYLAVHLYQYSGAPSWNFEFAHEVWIAEIDISSQIVNRVLPLSAGNIQWGEAMRFDSGFLYIMGSLANGSAVSEYLMRVPQSNPMTGARSYWNGSSWSSNASDAKPVATPKTGFSSIRKLNNTWYALETPGYATELNLWSASDVTGPWTLGSSPYKYPDNGTFKYAARFVPGDDSNDLGLAMLYCQSGSDQSDPTKYLPRFIRGPQGTAASQGGGGDWHDRREVTSASAAYGNMAPGTVFSARVRAVDSADPSHASVWMESDPIILAPDNEGPPKPAKPIVTSQFRGARVEVSGLSESGGIMPPDFDRFEVHMSDVKDFKPDESTRIDSFTTRGGVSSVQGIPFGTTKYFRVVAVDHTGNWSEPSDCVSGTAERLSDPDLPDKLITGAKLADNSISAKNITVATFDNSIAPNGNFESAESDGRPSHWSPGWWEGSGMDGGANFVCDSSSPLAGSMSLKMTTTDSSSMQLGTEAFPITGSDVYYFAGKFKTSRLLSAESIQFVLSVSDDPAQLPNFGFYANTKFTMLTTKGDLTGVKLEGNVETDAIHKWGAVYVFPRLDGATPYNTWVDDIEVRKVVGEASIANASINRAKIRDLAVDDAKIASMNVGKLVTGQLFADITVSSRIMTAQTGARSQMDQDGFSSFDGSGKKTFSTQGGNAWMSGVMESGEIRGGKANFPSQYDNAPGHTKIDGSGLAMDADTTTNLVPNPQFYKNLNGILASNAAISIHGTAVKDLAGNIDWTGHIGNAGLKVIGNNQAVNSPGWAAVPIGYLSANTTYTVSWYSSCTSADDNTVPNQNCVADFANIRVAYDPTLWKYLATGISGYLLLDGALAGEWDNPRSSGYDTIGRPNGWHMRSFLTFKTPSDMPNKMAFIMLPAPRKTDGSVESSLAAVYDGIQCEAKPYMTRYCDGDQFGCEWTGERHNSASIRKAGRAAWIPANDDPQFLGRIQAPMVRTSQMKLGSGFPHGSNFVETLMGESWDCVKGGSGWWSQINWDNKYNAGVGTNNPRITADDGDIFPSYGSIVFNTTLNGFYIASATITFPWPEEEGYIGLRLRQLYPDKQPRGTTDDSGIVAQSKIRVALNSGDPSRSITVTWMGYCWAGWGLYWEAYQTVMSGTASMPGQSPYSPCRASLYMLL